MVFASRVEAGEELGRLLRHRAVNADIVFGLPRGGMVVASVVARALELPLRALIVRKIGHPLYREFAVGALGEGGVLVLDERALKTGSCVSEQLRQVINEETQRLNLWEAKFHLGQVVEISQRSVLLVDDGLATGATTEAAVISARKQDAARVIVAAPVASADAFQRLLGIADEVIVVWVDPEFEAVGRYYEQFPQTGDEEVIELLNASQDSHSVPGAHSR